MPPFSGRGRLKAANKWKFKTSNRTLDQDVWSISSAAMEVVVGGGCCQRDTSRGKVHCLSAATAKSHSRLAVTFFPPLGFLKPVT